MNVSTIVKLYSIFLSVISVGAFYKDEKIVEDKTEYLIACSEKIEEKLNKNQDVFEVLPKDIIYESRNEHNTTYYVLKTTVNLCFIEEKIIKIERCYFHSSF